MPAGVSWPKYLLFFSAAMFSMLAGAQTVHVYYRPLDDLNKYIEAEVRRKGVDNKLVAAKGTNA